MTGDCYLYWERVDDCVGSFKVISKVRFANWLVLVIYYKRECSYELYFLDHSVNDSKEDDEEERGVQITGLVAPEQGFIIILTVRTNKDWSARSPRTLRARVFQPVVTLPGLVVAAAEVVLFAADVDILAGVGAVPLTGSRQLLTLLLCLASVFLLSYLPRQTQSYHESNQF